LLLLPLWSALYPLSGAATLIGALSVGKVIGRAAPTLRADEVQVFVVATGAILVFVCTRLEQIFSRLTCLPVPSLRDAIRHVRLRRDGNAASGTRASAAGCDPLELAFTLGQRPAQSSGHRRTHVGMQWFSRRRAPRRLWHLLLATAKLRSPIER
jgi:hypothetical protein